MGQDQIDDGIEVFVSISDAMREFGVTRRQIDRYAEDGRLQKVQISPGRVGITLASIRAFHAKLTGNSRPLQRAPVPALLPQSSIESVITDAVRVLRPEQLAKDAAVGVVSNFDYARLASEMTDEAERRGYFEREHERQAEVHVLAEPFTMLSNGDEAPSDTVCFAIAGDDLNVSLYIPKHRYIEIIDSEDMPEALWAYQRRALASMKQALGNAGRKFISAG